MFAILLACCAMLAVSQSVVLFPCDTLTLQALSNLATSLNLSQQELLSYVWLTAVQNAMVRLCLSLHVLSPRTLLIMMIVCA